jgi:DNA helicase HerA-like ATPase
VGRMYLDVTVQAKKRRTVGAFIDTGSGMTILSTVVAEALGIDTSKPTDYTDLGRHRRKVCFAIVDMHSPETDCFVERFRVAVIATGEKEIPGVLLGADFLQRTGAILDFGRGGIQSRVTSMAEIRTRNPSSRQKACERDAANPRVGRRRVDRGCAR